MLKNSLKFRFKLVISKLSYILLSSITIYLLTIYLLKYFNNIFILSMYILIVVLILIMLICYLIKSSKLSNEEKKKICNELDEKATKVFKRYGLYVTENYVVCIGVINIFKFIVIPIKDIEKVDPNGFINQKMYKEYEKGRAKKRGLFNILKSDFSYIAAMDDNERKAFYIICKDEVYCITTYSYLNKTKSKRMEEIAKYIASKSKKIKYY